MNLKITTYCKIDNDSCSLNGAFWFRNEDKETSLSKAMYKTLGVQYPKYYKMDILSKYGFIASELILANNKNLKSYKDDEIAMLFANTNSSTITDLKYQKTIQDIKPSPSPSLFVYTLPNIILGEIAIRNKWYGENNFFVLPEFDAKFFVDYTEVLLTNENNKACLIAWVDIKENKNDVFLLSVENDDKNSLKNSIDFNIKNLKNLYNS